MNPHGVDNYITVTAFAKILFIISSAIGFGFRMSRGRQVSIGVL
jgi:hypothetical protein